MKNLITYLKALWSWVSGSQRKKIGVTLGEATIEHPFSTYSAPFGIRWKPGGKDERGAQDILGIGHWVRLWSQMNNIKNTK